MKLYESAIVHSPGLKDHPEFAAQRPSPIGIMGCDVYRFEGTNVYSWYINRTAGYFEAYGDPILLKPSEVKKFREGK